MEEGGALGFYAIEALAYIEEPALRAPLVAMVLLFLLLNVAVVGILFVYEVARIMFLDVAEVSGRGGFTSPTAVSCVRREANRRRCSTSVSRGLQANRCCWSRWRF